MDKELITEKIKDWIDREKLSLSAAGKLVGASHASVRRWLDGGNIRKVHWDELRNYIDDSNSEPESRIPIELKESYESLKTIQTDKSLFWVTEQYLRNTASIIKDKGLQKVEEPKEKTISFEVTESALPYINQKVAAGTGVEILEEKYQQRPDMHILEVTGESMQPTYMDGQKLIVQLFQERVIFGDDHIPVDIVKNMIPDNSVIIYDLNGAGLAMKRVKYQKNKKSWYFILEADNEDWASINDFPRYIRKQDEFTIFGRVIGVNK